MPFFKPVTSLCEYRHNTTILQGKNWIFGIKPVSPLIFPIQHFFSLFYSFPTTLFSAPLHYTCKSRELLKLAVSNLCIPFGQESTMAVLTISLNCSSALKNTSLSELPKLYIFVNIAIVRS